MNIPLEVTGSIANSNKPSHKVRVSDDSANTGGFLIYEWWDGSNGPNGNFAFDDWSLMRLLLKATSKNQAGESCGRPNTSSKRTRVPRAA